MDLDQELREVFGDINHCKVLDENSVEMIRQLLNDGADPDCFVMNTNNVKTRPLWHALKYKSSDLIELLLEYGASRDKFISFYREIEPKELYLHNCLDFLPRIKTSPNYERIVELVEGLPGPKGAVKK